MQKELKELIVESIKDIEKGDLSDRVVAYNDYKQKYVVPKPSVKVEIELTSGKVAKLDITDYFKGEIK